MNAVPQLLQTLVSGLHIPESVLSLLASHPYIIVFVGLLLGGETVLLPALYFAVIGVLNGGYVMGIMILATVISDAFWYALGRGVLPTAIRKMVKQERLERAGVFSRIGTGKELIILFYSKFIYGTRIAAQIFCGMRRVNFSLYLGVNTLAVIALGSVYYFAVSSSLVLVNSLDSLHFKLLFALALVAMVAGLLHFGMHHLMKRKSSIQ